MSGSYGIRSSGGSMVVLPTCQSTKSATLTGSYEYNSSHKKNSVTHLGTGRYVVLFPGRASAGVHGP